MEELKIIVDTLNKLGGNAVVCFIVWILIKYALSYILTFTGFVIFGCLMYKILLPLTEKILFLSEIKKVMGYSGPFMDSEKRNIIRILKKHQEEK